MPNCFTCGKFLPEKTLTEMVEGMEDYRDKFDDWDEAAPVLICTDCYEERQEDE